MVFELEMSAFFLVILSVNVAVLISFLSASIASFAHGKYMHVHGVCMCKCKHRLNLELFVERHVPRLR